MCVCVCVCVCSLSCDQAGALYSGDDTADVQDPGPERPHPGLLPECPVSGWNQVQRCVSGKKQQHFSVSSMILNTLQL